MHFLKTIYLISFIFLSQISTYATDDLMESKKYSISFLGLEMMKMEFTFHVAVMQEQEVIAITQTLAEAYQPYLKNNKNFFDHQKNITLANASSKEIRKFLEKAFMNLEEKFFLKDEVANTYVANTIHTLSLAEKEDLGGLAAAIIPPSSSPPHDPPSDKENDTVKNLLHSQKGDEDNSKANLINTELVDCASTELTIEPLKILPNESIKDSNLRRIDFQEVEYQGFCNLFSPNSIILQTAKKNFDNLLQQTFSKRSKVSSKETAVPQTFFLDVQIGYDFVHEWLVINKSLFRWPELNPQTALFLAYLLSFIFFCYPQFSRMSESRSHQSHRHRI